LALPERLESRRLLAANASLAFAPVNDFTFGPVTSLVAPPASGDFVGSVAVSTLAAGGAGIAVTSFDAAAGRLFYSTDSGGTWTEAGAISGRSALLLHATPQTRLAFRPYVDSQITATDAVTFRVWEGTGGFVNGATGIDTLFVASQVVARVPTSDSAVAAAVAANGSFAVIAERGSGVRVVSLLAANRGATLATLDTPGAAVGVAISVDSRQAYVADDYGGLAIIDLTTPSQPRISATVATTGFPQAGYAYGVAATAGGRYLFVAASSSGLDIVDLLAAGGPRVIRNVALGGYAIGVAATADGRYAFVTNSAGTVQVVDAVNPATAAVVRTVALGATPESIAIGSAGVAVVACGEKGVKIVSSSAPATAAVIGSVETPGRAWGATFSADGKRAYVADRTAALVLDLTSPAAPRIVGGLDGAIGTLGLARGPSGLVVVADGGAGSLVVDTTRPNTTATVPTTGGAKRLTLRPDGAYAFVADNTAGLQLIRTGGIGTEAVVGTLATGRRAADVAVSANGRYAYVADTMTGLVVVDALDPAAPRTVTVITEPLNAVAVATSADGRYAYVGDRFNGLSIYDLINPAAPLKLKSVAGAWPVVDVAVAPNRSLAVVAVDSSGIEVFDVASPASARSTARLSLGGEAAVAVAIGADNQTAYAVTETGRLHAVSLANPAAPRVVATLQLGPAATGIGLTPDGGRAFVTLGAEGIAVVDLTDSSRPRLIGRIVAPGEPQSAVVTSGEYLFVAANSAGLFVQDVTPLEGFSSGAATVSAMLGGTVDTQGNVQLERTAAGEWLANGTVITSSIEFTALEAQWQLLEAEIENGERLVTARHRSGALHRFVADDTWRLVGFAGIRNATSIVLPRSARGAAVEQGDTVPAFPANVTAPIDLTGTATLRRNATGRLFAGAVPLERAGEPLVQSAIVGAVPLAAEALPEGNRLLLRTTTGGLVVWRFDTAWRFVAAEAEVARTSAAATVLALQFGMQV
jgi:hypothetical protein